MPDENKTEKLLCPTCGVETNHEVVWKSRHQHFEDEEIGLWESTDFDLLQCLGCETPTLRRKYSFSEDINLVKRNGEWIDVPQITLWPKTGYRILKIKSVPNAPPTVKRIYRETIEAYNNELPTLCTAGIRAVIEAVCKEKGINERNLELGIDELKGRRLINEDFAIALHENRLLGNEAMHESTLFGDLELQTAIELVESLMDTVYEAKSKADMLKHIREARKSTKLK